MLESKKARAERQSEGDTAGTAAIAVINYFEGRLNLRKYWLVIGLAGVSPQRCGFNFMPAINLTRTIMVESADGCFGWSMGKLKRDLAEEPVLSQVQYQ
jgi:hypothetical protein